MNRFLIVLFFGLICIHCIAQEKHVIVRDTVVKEITLVSKASADSVQQIYVESLKGMNELIERRYSSGYTVINTILVVCGLILTILVAWGVSSILGFRNQSAEAISRFRETTEEAVDRLEEFRNEINIRTNEFSTLITSMGSVIDILASTSDENVIKALRNHLVSNQGIVVIGQLPQTMDMYNALFLCTNEECTGKFFSGILGMVDLRDFRSTHPMGRPPVVRICPHCQARNSYSANRPSTY